MKKDSGYTLAEIMIASAVAIVALGVLVAALMLSERMWRWEVKQSTVQRDAQVMSERIAKSIRPARAVYIQNSGDTVQFVTDINLTPFIYTDDVAGLYKIKVNGNVTPEGEAVYDLIYDSDVSSVGDEETLCSYIVKDAAVQMFRKTGGFLSVNFSVKDDYARDGFQSTDVSFWVRNRNF